jgi:hypothetical protein
MVMIGNLEVTCLEKCLYLLGFLYMYLLCKNMLFLVINFEVIQ